MIRLIHNARLHTIALGLLLAMLLAACGAPQPAAGNAPAASPGESVSAHGGPVADYVSLVDALRAAGATVTPGDEVEQPFFEVKGRIISVNGADVQVFEFADAASARDAAAQIMPDGNLRTTMIEWIGPPHFFQAGRLIVLYVGTDAGVIKVLGGALGPQIAGR